MTRRTASQLRASASRCLTAGLMFLIVGVGGPLWWDAIGATDPGGALYEHRESWADPYDEEPAP